MFLDLAGLCGQDGYFSVYGRKIVGDLFMAFRNYILLIVLTFLIGFLFVSYRRKLIENVLLRRAVNVFTIISVVFTTFSVVLFPGLGSVKTTGEYSYTSCVLELTDTSRIENYKSDGSPRPGSGHR